MAKRSFLNRSNTVRLAVLAITASSLAACGTIDGVNDNALVGAIKATTDRQANIDTLDPVAAAAFWGTRYDRDPRDADVAVSFSQALRKIGSHDESLRVISKTAELHPDNVDVKFEFAKTLIEDDRGFEAVRHLEHAQEARPDDWRVLSAYGVALDQIGEHKSAREKYNRALALVPDHVNVLNNKGLSYVLSGDLDKGFAILRLATGKRAAGVTVRQNLALVSALKGDIQSAERLARSDLPPQIADNNVQYFRNLLSQPAYWQNFAASDFDVPDFGSSSVGSATDGVGEGVGAPVPLEVEPLPPIAPQAPSKKAPKRKNRDDNSPMVLGPTTAPSNASFRADEKPVDSVKKDDEKSSEEGDSN